MGEMKNIYKVSLRTREEKRPVGRFKHRLEDNIKIDFKNGALRV
jgi:hypothetical protein